MGKIVAIGGGELRKGETQGLTDLLLNCRERQIRNCFSYPPQAETQKNILSWLKQIRRTGLQCGRIMPCVKYIQCRADQRHDSWF